MLLLRCSMDRRLRNEPVRILNSHFERLCLRNRGNRLSIFVFFVAISVADLGNVLF